HLSTAQADKRPFILSDVVTNATAATIRQARRQAAAARQQESKKRCVGLWCAASCTDCAEKRDGPLCCERSRVSLWQSGCRSTFGACCSGLRTLGNPSSSRI